MAVIVKHRESGTTYILIGTGYSFYKDSRPSFIGGTLFPHEEEGLYKMAALSDGEGEITWLPADELKVIEIDGIAVKQILDKYNAAPDVSGEVLQDEEIFEECPACGTQVSKTTKECPSCGLTLILDK